MKYLIIITLFQFLLIGCIAQKNINLQNCEYRIELNDFNRSSFFLKPKDSIIAPIGAGRYYIINLSTCLGTYDFEGYDADSIIYIKGQYIETGDTLEKYSTALNPITLEEKRVLVKYFEPLRNGIFTYWENGVLIKKESYNKGTLIEELKGEN